MPERVFLVEDNEGDVYLISLALQQAGFPQAAQVFRDGAEAIEFLREPCQTTLESLPELILVDMNLPRVDGGEFVEMLRANPAYDGIPVMLLSSSRSPEDAAKAEKFRKCMYALKPSNLTDFMKIGMIAKDFWLRSKPLAAAV